MVYGLYCLRFIVYDVCLKGWGLWLRVQELGFMVSVWGLGFRVPGLGLEELGFRVWAIG